MPSDQIHAAPAYRILRDATSDAPPPLILASPHSGRDYPAAFLAQTRLAPSQLRRAEDAYVDQLLGPAVKLGVPLIAANYGRSYLDLNRDPEELDPGMFVDPLPANPSQSSERVAAGLGILPRIAAAGLDIYATKLRTTDARARIDSVHTPYHAALRTLIDEARATHGYAVLLDCHSMPTPAPAPGGAPQFVLGDLFGRSADGRLVELIDWELRAGGFRVARNMPYAGGYTTANHAAPAQGIHVVQIEIDRALYMDPSRLSPHAGFATIAATLERLVRTLLDRLPTLDLVPTQRLAAE